MTLTHYIRFYLDLFDVCSWMPPSPQHLSPAVMVLLRIQTAGYGTHPFGVWRAVRDVRRAMESPDPAPPVVTTGRRRYHIPAIYTNPDIRRALGLKLRESHRRSRCSSF